MLHRLDAESRRMVRFQDSSGIISCSWVAFGKVIGGHNNQERNWIFFIMHDCRPAFHRLYSIPKMFVCHFKGIACIANIINQQNSLTRNAMPQGVSDHIANMMVRMSLATSVTVLPFSAIITSRLQNFPTLMVCSPPFGMIKRYFPFCTSTKAKCFRQNKPVLTEALSVTFR